MRVDHNVATGQAFPIATDYLHDRFTIAAVLASPIAATVALNVDAVLPSLSVDQACAVLATMIPMAAIALCRELAAVSRMFTRRRTTTNLNRQIRRRLT